FRTRAPRPTAQTSSLQRRSGPARTGLPAADGIVDLALRVPVISMSQDRDADGNPPPPGAGVTDKPLILERSSQDSCGEAPREAYNLLGQRLELVLCARIGAQTCR